jgi:hypothetical protein
VDAKPDSPILGASRFVQLIILFVLLLLGLAVRMYDLTDLPLDFHPTRQLLSALKARGMYYQATRGLPEWQRKMAVQQWKSRAEVEPEIFENLVAFTYRATGVHLWVARVYASVFWLIGGMFLYLLIRGLVSHTAGLLSVAYYLFFPYAVIASRSFQPDVMMIMLILGFWWSVVNWSRHQTWQWAVLAGLLGGLAILVKFVAAFFVIAGALGTILGALGLSVFRRRQVWLVAALGILPAGLYLYYGIVLHGFLGRQFAGRFIPALLLSPVNYLQWATEANLAAGGVAIALGLLGVLLARTARVRSFLVSLWIAYLLYGVFFDYHVATHDYYHLPLIAIVSVSVAPLAASIDDWPANEGRGRFRRYAIYGLLLYGISAGILEARAQLKAVDYRPEAKMWERVGDLLGHGPNVVALTQDYGSSLEYWGWQNALIWPNSGDTDYHEARGASISFGELFSKLAAGNQYFLVTDFPELERQPLLEARLSGFSVFAHGPGFTVYDLQRPVGQ